MLQLDKSVQFFPIFTFVCYDCEELIKNLLNHTYEITILCFGNLTKAVGQNALIAHTHAVLNIG